MASLITTVRISTKLRRSRDRAVQKCSEVSCQQFECIKIPMGRMFGVREQSTYEKRHEVMGGWRKLHNEELHNLNSLLV
jgi:hypothetical protein